MKNPLKCAVIGAGVIGAAAAAALAKRGAATTVYEQFSRQHKKGGSHGTTRLFRIAYFEDPAYVPLAQKSARLWRKLEQLSNRKILKQTGVLIAGAPQGKIVQGSLQAAQRHGLSIESLDGSAARRKAGWVAFDNEMAFLFEAEGGVLLAEAAHLALLEEAIANSARILENTRITAIEPYKSSLRLYSDSGTVDFDRVVIAAGPWAPQLVEAPGIIPIQKTLCWMQPRSGGEAVVRNSPAVAIEEKNGDFYYAIPPVDHNGVKFGAHHGGAALGRPGDMNDLAHEDAIRNGTEYAKLRYSGLVPAVTSSQRCLYDMSPDGHFVIDYAKEDNRILVGTGFSGHGFKFAPVIGEALAQMALDGEMPESFSLFRASRFDA
ncbi:MAG: N-methyl-L-tryptophan oxidase [Pseudomonadota bacterium]